MVATLRSFSVLVGVFAEGVIGLAAAHAGADDPLPRRRWVRSSAEITG